MESIIKWNTGTPKSPCSCIVTVKNHKGKTYTSTDSWIASRGEWSVHNYKYGYTVIGWCPISEITPLNVD
jgi:hypothetical protein